MAGDLAAELERDLLEVAGSGLGDQFADLGGAGEGDLVDEIVGGERGSAGLAEAGEDVDDASGEACLLDELSEAKAGERGLLGELQDDGAAGCERGAELPGGHEKGEVPGDDLGDDADRLPDGVGEEVAGKRDGDSGSEGLGGPAAHVAEEVDGEGDVGDAGDGDGLAVVERFELGELVGVLLEEVGELPEELAAFGGAHGRPGTGVEGAAGGANGDVDVDVVSFGNLADLLAGSGVVDGEGLAGGGGDELSVDQHLVRGGDEVCGMGAEAWVDSGCGHVFLSVLAGSDPWDGTGDRANCSRSER